MRLMIMISLVLTGCIAVESSNNSSDEGARVLGGRQAAETRTCLPLIGGRALRVVDSGTVVYETGDTLWVNRLPSQCPGLDVRSALVVETNSGSYCKGDRFRELEWGLAVPGPYCILGEFTAYRRAG